MKSHPSPQETRPPEVRRLESRPSRAGGGARFWLFLLPPVAVGLALRQWNLSAQVLVEDELHVVRTALQHTLGEILFTYRRSDPCLPLAGFFRWAMNHGVVFSEMGLRLPSLVASVAAVGALPALARRWVGTPAALVAAWLLALSPSLILYGRIVRPYGPVSFLLPLAVLALATGLFGEGGRRSRGLALGTWAVAGAVAAYFYLGVAPVLAAVTACAGWLGRRTWQRPLAATVSLAAVAALWVVPAWGSLLWLSRVKGGRGRVNPEAWWETLGLQLGTASTVVAGLLALVTVAGWLALARRHRSFALLTLAAVAGQVLGLLVLRPLGLANALIVNRYLLGITPLLLLWLAAGLTLPWTLPRVSPAWLRGRRGRAGAAAAALGLVAWMVATGPLPRPEYRSSSFVHFRDFLRFDEPLARLETQDLPDFYRRLPELPPGPLLEMPFRTGWSFTRAPYVYQLRHGRRVYVSGTDQRLCDPHLALVNRLCLGTGKLMESPARYLVLHRDVQAEERRLRGVVQPELEFRPDAWDSHRRYAGAWSQRFRERFGTPWVETPDLEVWDLAAARAEAR